MTYKQTKHPIHRNIQINMQNKQTSKSKKQKQTNIRKKERRLIKNKQKVGEVCQHYIAAPRPR
jgi:hypothetical protein